MNSLNKKLILISLSALALTASTGLIVLTDQHAGLKIDFNVLKKDNQKKARQIDEQALTIQELGEVIKEKNDSISFLNLRVDELLVETDKLKNKVRSLDQRLAKMNDKVAGLSKQISGLKKGKTSDKNKIAALVKERDELLKHMEIKDKERTADKQLLNQKKKDVAANKKVRKKLEKQRDDQVVKMNSVDLPLQGKPKKEPAYAAPATKPSSAAQQSIEAQKDEIIKARKQARMREIVLNTTIDYHEITLRNNKTGKDLDKLKNDGWRYTMIEFDLKNPDQNAIFDEEFILQVFDVDNQKVVPYNESNPNFPNSDMGATGYKFTYEGKPLQIAYFNSQKKTAKNYEVRLYYSGKGFLLPIASGNTRIVDAGLVAAR